MIYDLQPGEKRKVRKGGRGGVANAWMEGGETGRGRGLWVDGYG